MATVTLRPNATVSNGWTIVPSGSAHTVVDDSPADDTSYLTATAKKILAKLSLGTSTIGATSRVAAVRVKLRMAKASSGDPTGRVIAIPDGASDAALTLEFQSSTTIIADVTSSWVELPALNEATTVAAQQAVVDALQVWLESTRDDVKVFEVYYDLDVWTAANAPTVTTVPNVSPISDRDVIDVTVTPSATLGDGSTDEWYYDVRLFTAAQYGAGGFDPSTSTATQEVRNGAWNFRDSGAVTVPLAEPLANSTTFRAYGRYGKRNVAGQTLWSSWAYDQFSVSLSQPAAPTCDAQVTIPQDAVYISITPAALTHDRLQSITVQRQQADGTWVTIRDGRLEADDITTAGLAVATVGFYDYDAPRTGTLNYRAFVREYLTSSSTSIEGTKATDTVDFDSDGTTWVLTVPDFDVRLGTVEAEIGRAVTFIDRSAVVLPLGASRPVVLRDDLDDGVTLPHQLTVTIDTWPDDTDLRDLLETYRGTLLFKWPAGGQGYYKAVGRTYTDMGAADEDHVQWTLTLVEVADGTDD